MAVAKEMLATEVSTVMPALAAAALVAAARAAVSLADTPVVEMVSLAPDNCTL